jgi:hypothetical protein
LQDFLVRSERSQLPDISLISFSFLDSRNLCIPIRARIVSHAQRAKTARVGPRRQCRQQARMEIGRRTGPHKAAAGLNLSPAISRGVPTRRYPAPARSSGRQQKRCEPPPHKRATGPALACPPTGNLQPSLLPTVAIDADLQGDGAASCHLIHCRSSTPQYAKQ